MTCHWERRKVSPIRRNLFFCDVIYVKIFTLRFLVYNNRTMKKVFNYNSFKLSSIFSSHIPCLYCLHVKLYIRIINMKKKWMWRETTGFYFHVSKFSWGDWRIPRETVRGFLYHSLNTGHSEHKTSIPGPRNYNFIFLQNITLCYCIFVTRLIFYIKVSTSPSVIKHNFKQNHGSYAYVLMASFSIASRFIHPTTKSTTVVRVAHRTITFYPWRKALSSHGILVWVV
jgi:hypothetical protein